MQATAEQLDATNKILTKEASTVLEALWNGQQQLVVTVQDLVARVVELEEPDEEHQSETAGDEPEDIPQSQDGEGEESVCCGECSEEHSEIPEEKNAEGGDAESTNLPSD